MQKFVDEFNANSSGFKVEGNLDKKHTVIVGAAEKNIKNLNSKNFRNWEKQNDVGLSYYITYLEKLFLDEKKIFFFSRIIKLVRKRLAHIFLYSSMLDDISILESLNAKDLLLENPQNKTPGAADFIKVSGYSVSFRWLRYLYITNQIRAKKLISKDGLWLDIGSYYGGLQGIVKKYNPEIKIFLLDFNHQLLRSYIYLKNLYPNANHILPSKVKEYKNSKQLPSGSIVYVEINDFKTLSKFNFDLVTNFVSFGEMKKKTFNEYFKSKIFEHSKNIYLINRFCSSPFFEKTYDDQINIFDYKTDKNISYFDIFPMGHYNILRRKIYNREFFRNISSPYFELIYSFKDG